MTFHQKYPEAYEDECGTVWVNRAAAEAAGRRGCARLSWSIPARSKRWQTVGTPEMVDTVLFTVAGVKPERLA